MESSIELKDKLNDFVASCDLVAISLQSIHADCNAHPSMILPSQTALKYDLKKNYSITDAKTAMICYLTIHVTGTAKVEEKEKIFKAGDQLFALSATAALTYRIDIAKFSEEIINTFIDRYVVLNGFPTLRSMVFDLSAKMGFQPITLPLAKGVKKEVKTLPKAGSQ